MEKSNGRLTWLGHNCFLFERDGVKFVVDPFLPKGLAPATPEEIKVDCVLVSHGHADHCEDALKIAKNNDATIVSVAEVSSYFAKKGVKTEALNIGGAIYLPTPSAADAPQFQLLAVQAPHSSTMPDGSSGGSSLGFVLSFSQNGAPLSPAKTEIKPMKQTLADADAFSVYFACDAGYSTEMNWIGELGIDLAILPIGDRFTMGPAMSLDAINAIKPRFVVPAHYNTWPPIAQDVSRWQAAVRKYTSAVPLVLAVGSSICKSENGDWR